jgi:membrane fusion protein (multidrug efflux system)
MKSKSLIIVVLFAAVAVGGYWLGSRAKSDRAPAPAAGGSARGPAAALPAEGFRVTGETVTQHLSAVGTLVPRESVVLVSELPRRLVSINFEEGAVVEKDALLFKLDDSDLLADLGALEVRRKLYADMAQRQRDLLAKQTTSQQDFDRAQADLDGVVAEMRRKQVDLAKTEIRAPFAGRIGFRNVSEGAYVTANTPLANLQDTSELKVDFSLPERYADEITSETTFTFTVSASADTYSGRVVATEPQIDPATRSLHVRGLTANKDGRLAAGMFANVEIAIDPTNDGIMVPSRAIVPSANGHSVFVAADGVATEHAVAIGIRTPERVQILSGLKEGDVVLTSNLLRIRDRSPVEVNRIVTE